MIIVPSMRGERQNTTHYVTAAVIYHQRKDICTEMKKIFAVFAAFIMVLCMSSCGSDEKKPDKNAEVTTTEDPNTIEVPKLIGLERYQLEMKYSNLNFNYIDKYDDNAKQDVVIAQSPDPGTRIKKADEISVTISIGAKQVEVDDYKDQNIEAVKTLIEKQGLKYEIQYVESDTVQRNCVISTTPAARTMVDKGTMITCFVSLGSPQQEIRVPGMVGMSFEEAVKLAKGIVLVPKYDDTSQQEPGTIIEQSVDPNTIVEPNQRIEVTVAGERAIKTSTISVPIDSKLEAEFEVKFYIDGTLVEEKTVIKEISLTRVIDWEVSATDVHTYTIMVTSRTTGRSGKLIETEIDFTQNPPVQNPIEPANTGIFEELLRKETTAPAE